MATPEQKMQDEQDFDAAYAAEDAPTAATPSDDDAFGLVPEGAGEEDDGIPNSPEEATEATMEEAPTVEAAPATGEAPAGKAMQPAGLSKDEQRLKSWEGRLKAREAELKAAGHDMGTGEEEGESILEDMGESKLEESGEEVADKLKGMSPDEAMRILADDFGEDFAKMLSAVIDAKVAQASSSMGQSVDEIINDIVDTKARAHFETIADRHPDFMDISTSEAFKGYLDAMPEEGKAEAQRVIENGTAREINKLLDGFKASTAQPAGQMAGDDGADNTDSMDAAEGVRSTGMRLPTQPGASKDYAAAWDEFGD